MIAVGCLLATHHLRFYLAIHRLPLGVAVTQEFVGTTVDGETPTVYPPLLESGVRC